MENDRAPAIAIMAGGQSRRMGRDKAAIEVDGTTLLDRIIDAARHVSDTVAVVGRVGERDDVVWIKDDTPGLGPLGGLRTALAHLDRPIILLACDMPRVDADALQWLVDNFRKSSAAHGVATTRKGQLEPLFSIYRPAAAERVDAHIAAGHLSVHRLIEDGDFDIFEAPEQIGAKLLNINTPQDLDALK